MVSSEKKIQGPGKMKKIPLCPPLLKGEFMRNKIIHPHPDPLPSREREIKVKGLYR
jgi:hypothetical protein